MQSAICNLLRGGFRPDPGQPEFPGPAPDDQLRHAADPGEGRQAVIVFGKKADWTQAAALRVQKAIQEWSGKKLDVIDDQAATSEETWLLAEAYRHTPMIVIGNTQDNRLIQALGTRYMDASNHSWPGGDRYLVRTLFEPFAADTNYIVLSGSGEAGMAGATDAFEAGIKKLPKDDASTIPFTRIIAGTKDKWLPVNNAPAIPKEFATPPRASPKWRPRRASRRTRPANRWGIAPFPTSRTSTGWAERSMSTTPPC